MVIGKWSGDRFLLYYKSHFLMILGAIVTVILAYWLCTGENGRLFDKKCGFR